MAAQYDYLFLTLEPGRAAHRALAERVAATPLAQAGGAALGQFFPQLGWASNEAAVLLRWDPAATEREALVQGVTSGPPVAASVRRKLKPTIRPADGATLAPGGIHVHRWFHVATGAVAEFVELSSKAWPDFEARFDADIFGLFEAEQTTSEAAAGEIALLLITRYASHGVWEDSRDPTTEAMQIFARRQALTRLTRAASTLLMAG